MPFINTFSRKTLALDKMSRRIAKFRKPVKLLKLDPELMSEMFGRWHFLLVQCFLSKFSEVEPNRSSVKVSVKFLCELLTFESVLVLVSNGSELSLYLCCCFFKIDWVEKNLLRSLLDILYCLFRI
mgnify:CR=1 FL=1